MSRIISLLNEKNHYLEKFYSINEQELANFAQGNFDNLQAFYQARERILDVLRYVDAQLEKSSQELGTSLSIDLIDGIEVSAEMGRQIKNSFAIKDQYVARIIEQDIQVLVCIEKAKNLIIKELQETRKARKGLIGYRVNTFTNRLDEEV